MALTCPIPPDEVERLKTLHALDLLDLSYEPSFDRITSLCCQIFEVPIALVSLVDAERQFFKSQRGLGEVRETARDLAFCAHAIMPDAPNVMTVLDAEADDRFKGNALVTDWPHIRFYAGTALRVAGGDGVKRPIGTLCVIDTAIEHGGTGARTEDGWGVREKQILLDFGALLTGAIEARQQARIAMTVAKTAGAIATRPICACTHVHRTVYVWPGTHVHTSLRHRLCSVGRILHRNGHRLQAAAEKDIQLTQCPSLPP